MISRCAWCNDPGVLIPPFDDERVTHRMCNLHFDLEMEKLESMKLLFKALEPSIQLPKRSYNSAGFDLFAIRLMDIPPGVVQTIPLGFATSFDLGYVALIWDRGSMAINGLHTFAGVVDHDYLGEWKVVMYNSSSETQEIKVGQKVAQVLFQKVYFPEISVVNVLPESERGTGAFGSSGR